MMNNFLVYSIGTLSVERFSHKMIKTGPCSRISDCSIALLMRISIEGPEIDAVEFEKIRRLLKNKIIDYYFDYVV